jgi:excisionase family DNA binding protein
MLGRAESTCPLCLDVGLRVMVVRHRDTATDDMVDAIAGQVVALLATAETESLAARDRRGRLLTVAEAARHARCSARTLRRALNAGRLRASQPAGRGGKLLIAVDDLERWLFGRGNSVAPSPDAAAALRRRRVEPRGTPGPISIEEIQRRRV